MVKARSQPAANAGGDRKLQSKVAVAAACLAIVIAGVLAYSNSFAGVFVLDDERAIVRNPMLASVASLGQATSAPKDTTLAGRPFATLTFVLDHARARGDITAYHGTNLAIHVASSLALFAVLRRTFRSPVLDPRVREQATALAFATSILFIVHPLQTGSVTYIVQRVESLMGLFYLLTLYCAIRALEGSKPVSLIWTAAATSACALGMATKEVMVTAPIMAILWERQFGSGRSLSSVSDSSRRLNPLFRSLAATWLILAWLVIGGHRDSSAGFGFEGWPWWRYLVTQAGVLIHYLKLAFVPDPLVLDYDWPAATSFSDFALSGAVVLALLLLAFRGAIRRYPASFAGVWFFLVLAPTSSVLPIVTEVAAEHRMYLPLAGLLALVVVTVFLLTDAAERRLPERASWLPKSAAMCALLVVVIVFGRLTYGRNADYHHIDRIWYDTIEKRPGNARARINYANSLMAQGRFAEAETHLRVAVERRTDDHVALVNLGAARSAQRKLDDGAHFLQRAVDLKPDFAEAHRNLGENRALAKQFKHAADAYITAVELRPHDVGLLNRASWILATAPDPAARDGHHAVSLAERAIELTNGRDALSFDSLGVALAETGDFEGAIAATERAALAARASGTDEMVSEFQSRMTNYAQGQKVRSP